MIVRKTYQPQMSNTILRSHPSAPTNDSLHDWICKSFGYIPPALVGCMSIFVCPCETIPYTNHYQLP